MSLRVDYFFGEALINLRRNLLMTLAAVSIVLFSLVLLASVMVVGQIVEQFTGGIESQVEVNVFLREDITPEQTKDLQSATSAMPEIKSVDYISKEDAFSQFKKDYKETPAVWENVDPDALPASFRIKLRNAADAPATAARLDGRPGVDDAVYGGEGMERLLRVIRLLRVAAFAFTGFFLLAATVLISNTVRLAIYARRREIAIMRLVGASNWFIRVPFVFEGMLEGAMGALLSTGIVVAAKVAWLDSLQKSFVFLPVTVGWDVVLRVFAWLLLVGMAVGALGSVVALRRFLEV